MSEEFDWKVPRQSMDINRDFPYDQSSPNDCLNTVAARILYKLFIKNHIDAAITFHGGTNVLSYPWGSYSRSISRNSAYEGYPTPDHASFDSIAKMMGERAGSID